MKSSINIIFVFVGLLFYGSAVHAVNDEALADMHEQNKTAIAEQAVAGQTKSQQTKNPSADNWLDSSRYYVAGSADALVIWVDSFFDVPRNEFESAYSSLRLRTVNEWEEGSGNSAKVKLRGKVRLPRINKRLSLVFTDDDEKDEDEEADAAKTGINEVGRKKTTKVGLRYRARDDGRSRVDYGIGLRSSLKFKANVRYRYQAPFAEHYLNRFTNTLYFHDGDGFGVKTRYEVDRVLDDRRLIRWSNTGKFAEDIDGVEWGSQLQLAEKIDQQSAVSSFIWASGTTRPDYLTTSYGLGVTYRRSFIRSWLFYELEPAYVWRRETRLDSREGVALFTLRFEALIERLDKQGK